MIHVRMGHDHIKHRAALRFSQGNANAAGIDCDAIVDEKAGQALLNSGAPFGVERAGKKLNVQWRFRRGVGFRLKRQKYKPITRQPREFSMSRGSITSAAAADPKIAAPLVVMP